jgi:predicted O-methyltransferase YrrM
LFIEEISFDCGLNITMREKPFSQASENIKAPILEILKGAFENTKTVLEIGSGTGQHAVYLASNLSHLKWQPTDREIEFSGITLWLDEAGLANIYEPLVLDVNNLPWRIGEFDAVFTAC